MLPREFLRLSVLIFMVSGCAHRTLPRLMNYRLSPDKPYCEGMPSMAPQGVDALVDEMGIAQGQTGVMMLERGASALIARAWLIRNATRRIDAQYFIFASDNTGIVATDELLRAAERGVKVRLIVDDTLSHGDPGLLHALSVHPNAEVRIYNPVINVGRSTSEKVKNVLTDFRGVNQRMHNKLFLADGRVAVTGGRNVAAEYFDLKYTSNCQNSPFTPACSPSEDTPLAPWFPKEGSALSPSEKTSERANICVAGSPNVKSTGWNVIHLIQK